VYAPEAAQEARRVLNLGVPLAEMIGAGMATATANGRMHLESTAGELACMHEVIGSDYAYAVPRKHESRHGETVLSWVPLWDAMDAARELTAAERVNSA
jgi:hypothetical protein